MHSEEVIAKFGGQTALARLLGKSQSTIQHWAQAGRIPAKWQAELLRLARERGIGLSPSDFVGGSPHCHIVQFYEDDAFLVDRVAQFLSAGFESGNSCVVVATNTHRQMLTASLGRRGFDLDVLHRDGRYISADAEETLAKFMVNDRPDRSRCLATLKALVEQANAAATAEHPRAAVFGEMVAVLWKQKKRNAAIELECLWNDLESTCDFSLLCGYPMSGFRKREHSIAFLEVCSQHADVVPAESYSHLSTEPERNRTIARMQQRMNALESETRVHEQRVLMLETVTDAASWEVDLTEDSVRLSPKAQKLLGLEAAATVSLSELLQNVYNDADREAFLSAVKRARTAKTQFGVEFRVRDNGDARIIRATGKTFFNSGQALIIGLMMEKNRPRENRGNARQEQEGPIGCNRNLGPADGNKVAG